MVGATEGAAEVCMVAAGTEPAPIRPASHRSFCRGILDSLPGVPDVTFGTVVVVLAVALGLAGVLSVCARLFCSVKFAVL